MRPRFLQRSDRAVEVKVSIAEPNPAISIFHDWGAYQPFGPCPTSGLIRIVWRAHRRKIRAVGSLEIASGAGGLPFFQLQPEDVVMRVQDLMAREVHSCQAEDSLETAAQRMWDHDCGCIPVCMRGNDDASKMIGVITDRDICMHALFQGMALGDLHVRDAMAKDIHYATRAIRLLRPRRPCRKPESGGYLSSTRRAPWSE